MPTARRRPNLFLPAISLALLGSGAAFGQAAMQCPAGQMLHSSFNPTGMVRTFPVPGSAGGIPSGVFMQPGFAYRMSAVGSIRVGAFGETGTPPEGWVPQGPAGSSFPAPDEYSFSLLYKVGNGGRWKMAGNGPITVKMQPGDRADDAQILFGINDSRLNDNSGVFIVTLTQLRIDLQCVNQPTTPAPAFFARGTAGKTKSGGGGARETKPPCDGKTPDGNKQVFQFPLYCAGNFSRNIPIEACTRAEALPEAQALARTAPPNCVLAP